MGLSLGRATVVDHTGRVLCDTFVCPKEGETIIDYCTQYSGITEEDIQLHGRPFHIVQAFVADLLQDKILVVHDRVGDLRVLGLTHPEEHTRDTATAVQLIRMVRPTGRLSKVGLKSLASTLLGRTIQKGEHCSLVDARVTMQVYRAVHKDWLIGPEHHLSAHGDNGGRGHNGGRWRRRRQAEREKWNRLIVRLYDERKERGE
ncbi:uncharacterized protein LOC143280334 [Babylonia areolata]|uniref:uncharacterized protein LOC143280334 n=1 Tax=Babylonia areolata TaxID=304850 RepID=UPI003FD0A84F